MSSEDDHEGTEGNTAPTRLEDVAPNIVRACEAAAAQAYALPPGADPDSWRMAVEALHRAVDAMMHELTVVDLEEWRKKNGR